MKATIVFQKMWEAINATNEDGSRKYKYIIHTGSSRSSKTYSILQAHWLRCITVPNTRVSIWRETKADCKMTILADLKKAIVHFPEFDNVLFNKTESIYQFPNGSTIEFMGGDEENRVHGFQGNVAHLNEPYGFKEEAFNQIDMRTSDYIIIDWNPKNRHFIDDVSKRDNAIVINSTYKDNPFVPLEQKRKIESYLPIQYCEAVEEGLIYEGEVMSYDFDLNKKNLSEKHIKELKKAIHNQNQKTSDPYMHMVYAKGVKAEKPNKIYKGWKAITLAEYNKIDEREYFGLDFGWAKPTALVGVKYDGDKSFYVRPALYKPMNEMRAEDGTAIPLGEFLTGAGFPQGNVTYGWADSSDKEAGSDLSLIQDLRENYLLNLVATNKPTYKARWELITKMNVFYVENEDFENEYDNYELEYINGAPTGKPIKKDDHCFIGSTMITTDKGNVMIKDVKVGNNVLTSNGYKKVLKTWDNGVKTVINRVIKTKDGIINITCTDNHKVFTNFGWVEVKDLRKGHSIITIINGLIYMHGAVLSVDIVKIYSSNVYDLTVEDEHEYFANGLLVHNCMNAFEYACWGIKQYLDIKL